MNKKFFQSALAVFAMMFGVSALAQTLEASQDDNHPKVAAGGTVVMNHQTVTLVAGNLEAADNVILRLPLGVNFVGTPQAIVAEGATLALGDRAGEPADGRTGGFVTLSDGNGDGGNDRAQVDVIIGGANAEGVVFQGIISVSSDYDGEDSLVSRLFVRRGETFEGRGTHTLAEVQSAAMTVKPVAPQGMPPVVSNVNAPGVEFGSTTHLLTIPAGYEAEDNAITVTLGSGLLFEGGSTTITATALTDDAPPFMVDEEGQIEGIVDGDTAELRLSGNTDRETQYLIRYGGTIESEGQPRPVAVAAVYSGGISGSATIASLADNGTMVSLAMAADGDPAIVPVDVVIGGGSQVDLPSFVISGIFPDDVGTMDGQEATDDTTTSPDTITVRPAAGVTISSGDNLRAACTGGTVDVDAAALMTTDNVLTLTITANCGEEAITVSGLTATLAPDAGAGPFALTLEGTADTFTDGIEVDVAQGVESGEVTVTRDSEMPARVGPGTMGTVDVLLTESTYGSLRVGTPRTYIIVIPSDNVMINSVGSTTYMQQDRLPQILNGQTARPPDGSYVLTVMSESRSLEPDDAVTLTISYTVDREAAIGGTVSFAIGGTAGASGTITAATVTVNTVSSAGPIPDVTASPNAVETATLTIMEQFATSLNDGDYRLLAPSGIRFAGDSDDGVRTTFETSDTLLVELDETSDTVVDAEVVTPNVIVGPSAQAGRNAFFILDGNGSLSAEDAERTNLTGGTVDLLYVGELDDLDAGADITIAQGFSISQSVSGGLLDEEEGEVYSATSSDDEVATVAVSGDTLTVTGLSIGAGIITVTDELGNTDNILVEVVAAGAAPDLSAVSTGGEGETSATISGGVTVDGGVTYSEDGVVTAGDDISILFTINVESDHVGEEGDIYVAVQDNATGIFFIIDGNSTVIPDSGIEPFDSRTLTASETVEIRGGGFINPSDLARLSATIFVGYTVDDLETIIFNGDGVPLSGE